MDYIEEYCKGYEAGYRDYMELYGDNGKEHGN